MVSQSSPRPETAATEPCPFELSNNRLEGAMLATSWFCYAVQVADDLVLIVPRRHLLQPWQGMFRLAYFRMLRRVITTLGWTDYTEYRNVGPVAGQQLPHVHYKIKRRVPGEPSSGLGPDTLERKYNELAREHEQLAQAHSLLLAALEHH